MTQKKIPLKNIDNLNDYIQPDWWKSLFNENYEITDQNVFKNKKNTESLVKLIIDNTKINKDSKILDLCCGNARHLIEFYKQGYRNLTGADTSKFLLSKINAKYRKRITLINKNAISLNLEKNSFDCITILGNSFGYFYKKSDDIKVIKNAFKFLKKGGFFIIDLVDAKYIKKIIPATNWEFINKNYIVCRKRQINQKPSSKMLTREILINTKTGIVADNIYSVRLYNKSELANILLAKGFKNIKSNNKFITKNKSGLDSGMMKNRLVIIARK